MMSERIRDEVLQKYSARIKKNREEHVITLKNSSENNILANVRTIPGIITQRGCCYAGCKGVVTGPVKDAVILVHGAIGCAFYAWGTRRHKAVADERDGEHADCYLEYCFSTDMQESDIVFGGEKKLKNAIKECVEIFHPAIIMVTATCPVGLIGDDINAVAKWCENELGTKCVAFSCEGYKGVSQSAGHHVASNQLMRHIVGTGDRKPKKKFNVNILGEFNIGGDGWEIERILKRCGIEVVSIFTGSSSYRDLRNAHLATLNIIQCHRSIGYVADMMKERYGTDWIKVNFIGIESCKKSLRDIGEYFDDPELKKRIEEVIADELSVIQDDINHYRSMLEDKKAVIFTGGSRSHHYSMLLRDLGVKTLLAGYEFAHRDDYQGREIIPFIKENADTKNIESISFEPDKKFYRERIDENRRKELREKGVEVNYYSGMMKSMDEGTIMADDLNHFETEEFLEKLKPDIFFSGIKDKFVAQKSGILSRQLHSYDYSGPYAGFHGAVIFAHDITMGLYTPAWKLVTPPWKKEVCHEEQVGGIERA